MRTACPPGSFAMSRDEKIGANRFEMLQRRSHVAIAVRRIDIEVLRGGVNPLHVGGERRDGG